MTQRTEPGRGTAVFTAGGAAVALMQLQRGLQGELLSTRWTAVRLRQRVLRLLMLQQTCCMRETLPTLLTEIQLGRRLLPLLLRVSAGEEAGQLGEGVCC